MSEIESVVNNKESCGVEQAAITDEENRCAAVQTRAMKVKEGKPQKPLKVTTIHELDIGPEELIEQQKTDETLRNIGNWLRIQWRMERHIFHKE